jgi:hypothetical protein
MKFPVTAPDQLAVYGLDPPRFVLAIADGVYPDRQLRTLQRRLKGWRREAARRLVFATSTVEPGFATGAEVPYAAAE